MFKPFDYFNAVSLTKKDIVRESEDPDEAIKGYVPWLVNKTLSYFPDAVFYANEINKYPNLPLLSQYDFYMCALNSKRRFTKQSKKIENDDAVNIATYYKCSRKKADEILLILTPEQLEHIKRKTDVGG